MGFYAKAKIVLRGGTRMRRGCISQGNIKCDNCGDDGSVCRTLHDSGRSRMGQETSEGGETKNFCVKCCVKKKYAEYREEKGDKAFLTFFHEEKKLSLKSIISVG
jgi:hypothetical protein